MWYGVPYMGQTCLLPTVAIGCPAMILVVYILVVINCYFNPILKFFIGPVDSGLNSPLIVTCPTPVL